MRTLAMPAVAELWSLTSLREKQSKIGREGRQPWPLRHPPDGRGRGATTDVPGNPVADHPVADTVRAGMRSAGPDATNDDGKRCASMQAKLRVSAPRRSQLIGSTLAAHAVRDLPWPTTGEGAILGATTTPNPGNVGLQLSTAADGTRRGERVAYQRQLEAAGLGKITTEIREAPPFYFAEDYHQQYLARNI